MDSEDITVDKLHLDGRVSCEQSNITELPPGTIRTSTALHAQELYLETATAKQCELWTHLAAFANRKSYMTDPKSVASSVQQYGWRHVGWGFHDGSGSAIAGAQISHLIQHPETLECVVTFQGTSSWNDWVSNLAISATSFCGLTYEDETCGGIGTCSVRKPRGSFVHWGFADRLMKVVQTDYWQSKVRANLHKCSKVYVTGHSLGGAQAELFTACAASAPKSGEFGYDEYKHIGWTTGVASRCAYRA
jgi:hypothetical protein